MSKKNVETVEQGFAKYAATGEVVWELFDEQVEVHDHDTPDQQGYRGHAGYRRWLDDWGAAWSEWSIDLEDAIDAGDSVVVFIRMKTTGRGSGIEVERLDAMTYGFRDGLIVRCDYYNDRAQALDAVGLAP